MRISRVLTKEVKILLPHFFNSRKIIDPNIAAREKKNFSIKANFNSPQSYEIMLLSIFVDWPSIGKRKIFNIFCDRVGFDPTV